MASYRRVSAIAITTALSLLAACSGDDGGLASASFGEPRLEILDPGTGDAVTLWPLTKHRRSETGYVDGTITVDGREVAVVVVNDYDSWLAARDKRGVWIYGRVAGGQPAQLYKRPYLLAPADARMGMRWRMRDTIEDGDTVELTIGNIKGQVAWGISDGPAGLRGMLPGWGPVNLDKVEGVNASGADLAKSAPGAARAEAAPARAARRSVAARGLG